MRNLGRLASNQSASAPQNTTNAMTYTEHPELDAARFSDAEEASDAFYENAKQEAPGIVLDQLRAIKTPTGWYDRVFALRNSAQDILQAAFSDSNDNVADRYAEFIIDMTPAARDRMYIAMAEWFASVWAYEIYTEHQEDLNHDV